MSIENILYKVQGLTKQLEETLTLQISCSDVESLISNIINNITFTIRNIGVITSSEESRESVNYAYLAQLERLQCALQILLSKLESLSCNEQCRETLEELLCVLFKINPLIFLINNFRLRPLIIFRDSPIFFECLLCDLIEKITDVENLVKDLVCVLILLIDCEIKNCTPCYVSTNSDKLSSSLREINNSIPTPQINCSDIESLISDTVMDTRTTIANINRIIGSEESRESVNYNYLAQLERLRCILEILLSKLQSFSCSERCPTLLQELLCILYKIYSLIFTINNDRLLPLIPFRDSSTFFECLLCDLIEEITDLENLLKDIVWILIALISCEEETCTPCYLATNSNKRPRPSVNVSLNQGKSSCNCRK